MADPAPKPVESAVTMSAQDFPLRPTAEQIKSRGLTLKNIETERGMEVKFAKPDTDYQVIYMFEREPCWTLVRIEDWSL